MWTATVNSVLRELTKIRLQIAPVPTQCVLRPEIVSIWCISFQKIDEYKCQEVHSRPVISAFCLCLSVRIYVSRCQISGPSVCNGKAKLHCSEVPQLSYVVSCRYQLSTWMIFFLALRGIQMSSSKQNLQQKMLTQLFKIHEIPSWKSWPHFNPIWLWDKCPTGILFRQTTMYRPVCSSPRFNREMALNCMCRSTRQAHQAIRKQMRSQESSRFDSRFCPCQPTNWSERSFWLTSFLDPFEHLFAFPKFVQRSFASSRLKSVSNSNQMNSIECQPQFRFWSSFPVTHHRRKNSTSVEEQKAIFV